MLARKPRFRRVHVFYKTTERDIEIARHVARHRFLTSQHLRRLVKGGGQGISRRLQVLFHAGILDRPRAQIDYFHRGGSRPMVYGLGAQGARLLCERGEKSSIDWTAKNRNATKLFIEHTLRVADFMVALEASCREITIVRHVPAEEIAASLSRKSRSDLRWRVSFSHRGDAISLGVIPDQIFALEFGSDPSHRIYYCLEADCATMPIVLNTKLRVRGHNFVSTGTLNECAVHPRDVFRVAVLSAAYAVVFCHNHPSGEPQPSQADCSITRRLIAAAEILGITVIDHVIIGHQRHCSLREMGLV